MEGSFKWIFEVEYIVIYDGFVPDKRVGNTGVIICNKKRVKLWWLEPFYFKALLLQDMLRFWQFYVGYN